MANNFFNWLSQSNSVSFIATFLIMFALVWTILEKSKIFNNKKTNIAISFLIGLMTGSITLVTECFSNIFARLAVAFAIFLVLIIISNILLPEKVRKFSLEVLGGITIVAVIGLSLTSCGIPLISIPGNLVGWILGALILGGLIFWIIKSTKPSDKTGSSESPSEDPPSSRRPSTEDEEDSPRREVPSDRPSRREDDDVYGKEDEDLYGRNEDHDLYGTEDIY